MDGVTCVEPSSGLSTGALVGIIIGSIAGVACFSGLVYIVRRR